MRLFPRIAVAFLAVAVPAALAVAGDPAAPVTLSPADMKWSPNPNAPGVMTAVAWGDPAKGAHAAFHKFEAGFTAPLHTHTANLKIVVVSGTMSLTGKDGKEMKFPAGSFYTQPNTYAHITRCQPGSECVAYVEADAAWDLKPVEVAAKK
jgi:anti-sigma factor ChrR (cupin superfamily)